MKVEIKRNFKIEETSDMWQYVKLIGGSHWMCLVAPSLCLCQFLASLQLFSLFVFVCVCNCDCECKCDDNGVNIKIEKRKDVNRCGLDAQSC